MATTPGAEVLLEKSRALENEFRWVKAAKCYERLLQSQHLSNKTIAETYLFYAESYSNLSKITDASQQEKESMLEKAVELGRKGLEHATRSGSPDALGSTLHALSKALHSYSEWKTANNERKKLIEEALIHRKRYNDIVERAFRFEP